MSTSTFNIVSWNLCLTETRSSNSYQGDISSGSWCEFLQRMLPEEKFQQFCDLIFENLTWFNEPDGYEIPTGNYKNKMKQLFNNFNDRFVFDRSFCGKNRKAFDFIYSFEVIIEAIKSNIENHNSPYDIILDLTGYLHYYVDLFDEQPELLTGCVIELKSKGIEEPESYDTIYKYIQYMVDFDNAIAYALINSFTIEELENMYYSYKRLNEQKIQLICEKIDKYGADMYCFQETNYEFIVETANRFVNYDHYCENNGTLCILIKKQTVSDVGLIKLTSEELQHTELKEYQSLILNRNGKKFRITNIHLASKDAITASKTKKPYKNYELQLDGLVKINEQLLEEDNITSILIGDFNHYSDVATKAIYKNPEFMTELKCRFITRQPKKYAMPSRNCKDGAMVWSLDEELSFNCYPLIDESNIGDVMLPNENCPSDHLPIMLEIRNSKN
jgi:hypothetical protein